MRPESSPLARRLLASLTEEADERDRAQVHVRSRSVSEGTFDGRFLGAFEFTLELSRRGDLRDRPIRDLERLTSAARANPKAVSGEAKPRTGTRPSAQPADGRGLAGGAGSSSDMKPCGAGRRSSAGSTPTKSVLSTIRSPTSTTVTATPCRHPTIARFVPRRRSRGATLLNRASHDQRSRKAPDFRTIAVRQVDSTGGSPSMSECRHYNKVRED